MNREEWLTCDVPQRMINLLTRNPGATPDNASGLLAHPASDRKLRLIACACCCSGVGTAKDDRALRLAERLADDPNASAPEWKEIRDLAVTRGSGWLAERDAVGAATHWTVRLGKAATGVIRDIIGDPWNPVALTTRRDCERCRGTGQSGGRPLMPTCTGCNGLGWLESAVPWLTPQVRDLTETAYQRREGWEECRHCRGKGHVRKVEIYASRWDREECGYCHGIGHLDAGTGRLDPVRLAVLADALVDAGLPEESLSTCPSCVAYHADPSNPFGVGPGYHPERDPASGRHEGGWTNCKRCYGVRLGRPGIISVPHPLLAALRSPGPHYRGFWALDVLLGKE